jgi:hypothetical protein
VIVVIALLSMVSAIFWSTKREMNGNVFVVIVVKAVVMSHMEQTKESK